MNQLQAYQKIAILSIVAMMVVASASLVLPEFCFAQDAQESENFEENSENVENQENGEIDTNDETAEAGDSTSEISLDEEAEESDGPVDTIIFSSKNFWEFRALPCFVKAGDWLTNLWQSSIEPKTSKASEWAYGTWAKKIKPFAQNTINQTRNFLRIGNRKDYLKTELEKEKEEVKQESPYLYKVFEKYEGFKEFIWGTNGTSTQETHKSIK